MEGNFQWQNIDSGKNIDFYCMFCWFCSARGGEGGITWLPSNPDHQQKREYSCIEASPFLDTDQIMIMWPPSMYFPFHHSQLGFALEKFFREKGDGGKSEGSESERANSRSNMTPLGGKTTLQCLLVILQAYVELVSREKGWEERGRIRAGKFPIQCDTSVEKGCQHRKCWAERKRYSTKIEIGRKWRENWMNMRKRERAKLP